MATYSVVWSLPRMRTATTTPDRAVSGELGHAGEEVGVQVRLLRSVAQDRVPAVEPRRVAYLQLEGPRAREQALTREKLAAHAKEGRLTILDVRPADEYRAAHLPGAASIPLEELEQRISELPADGELVAYCRGAYCAMAYEALDILRAHGLQARRLEDGMLEWRLAGLAVDEGAAA